MHVRITKKGRAILNNKVLSNKLVETISQNKVKLEEGEMVELKQSGFSIALSTSIKEVGVAHANIR